MIDVTNTEEIIDPAIMINDSIIKSLDPLKICETVINSDSEGHENKNHHCIVNDNAINLLNTSNNLQNNGQKTNIANVTSHHFDSLWTQDVNKIFLDTFHSENTNKQNNDIIEEIQAEIVHDINNFTIKNRPSFMPKGISPIIKSCNTKILNGQNIIEDEYYKDIIYENFAKSIVDTAQVYEPKIQNVNEVTNDTNKANNKVKKDNADLIFDALSIKEAKVLGQVDCKFIATIIHGKVASSNSYSDFLVLFDQHAVHERIRLEQNLSDYFDGTTWKSIKIDNITFKLSKDDAIFLHNYKDKFSAFGLRWNIIDNVISINGIPQAIFGKINRQVDVVLAATKNLLTELLDAMKFLKGNIPLYPQTIMNLVFSEACRYAIMFGDKLSKSNCNELIESLAECKTPFQCAHGRPVMAVIMEMNQNVPKYKISKESLKRFKERL